MQHKIDFAIGGQALIEGVMMRSPSYVTAAVRTKSGAIKTKEESFISFTKRYRVLGLPIIRGVINLFEMMTVGMRMLNFSAEEYAREEEDTEEAAASKGGKIVEVITLIISFVISLALALFLFKFIPLFITEWLRKEWPFLADNYLLFNSIDGVLRIAIFVLYIFILSRFKGFHRMFEYHGAEHMAVHAYEKGKALTVENVQVEHPEHPRCGTSFLLAVFLVSIVVYTLVPRNPVFVFNLLQRIAILPLIAGIGYEILKWSAKNLEHAAVKLIVIPGLLTQKITTQQPDEKQIEIAIKALQKALDLEKAKQG